MGLFINDEDHPDVYQSETSITEPNQDYFHYDSFAEMIKEQKQINQSFDKAFQELKSLTHKQQHIQSSQWQNVTSELDILKENDQLQQQAANKLEDHFATLSQNYQSLLEQSQEQGVDYKEVKAQLDTISQSNETISEKLTEHDCTRQQQIQQIAALLEQNKQMGADMSQQSEQQQHIIERLEKQEALAEKMHRQLTQFRSILFERSSYLAEKIENSYNLTSSYVYKLMTGSDQPVTYLLDNRKNDDTK